MEALDGAAQAEQMEHEVFSFQAEAVQILDLMIHSLYSKKEIFLRELISNSSDVIDRLRLELLSRAEIPEVDGIGQFGVGFYSSFIVAERVVLTTRRAGLEPGDGVRWESDGRGQYTLETIEWPERGTTIVLHSREGEDDLLSGWRLRSIIEKYSDHISVPSWSLTSRLPASQHGS